MAITIAVAASTAVATSVALAQTVPVAQQGPDWTTGARNAFYTQDQGSQLIPLSWFKALTTSAGKPFLDDDLARYGYLPNRDPSNPSGLPVGFAAVDTPSGAMAGMTCSACHTRQITIDGKPLRIDGGPAIVDFQSLLADLDRSMLDVLADKAKFDAFAHAVLGADADATKAAVLRAEATLWSVRFHTMMDRALPKTHPWGASRLDAISMIFDRVTGLDLGTPPTYLIPDNIVPADAPTRYPFLWNASLQDHTQWPGFSPNGNELYALGRNLGEVYGVFATFHPSATKGYAMLFDRNYISDNSGNFVGLGTLEGLIKRIGPPAWTWPYDHALAARGKTIYETWDSGGGQSCKSCHGINRDFTDLLHVVWKTPVKDVGTDRREWSVLTRYASSGSLEGASIPMVVPKILKRDLAFNLLKASVTGAIGENGASRLVQNMTTNVPTPFGAPLGRVGFPGALNGGAMAGVPGLGGPAGVAPPETMTSIVPAPNGAAEADARAAAATVAPSIVSQQTGTTPLLQLDAMFRLPGMRSESTAGSTDLPPPNSYEARVLQGIWAAAPYLHNGSVPTLADLLKPAAQRPTRFKVGPAYDLATVGLAVDQPGAASTLTTTTGCDDLQSGNSNCGHEYGTNFSDADKKALLEYLKTL